MSVPLTLGIDVGTGSAKGVLADADGTFFATASHAYSYSIPFPHAAEQDPADWWDAVCHVTHQLLKEHPQARKDLRAVAISGQGVAAVVLGKDRRPLRNAMLWMDTRCSPQAKALAETHGDAIARTSGKQAAAYALEPKLIWMQQNEPELWADVWKVMTTTAYVNLRLTDKTVMNHSDAGILLAYDLKNSCWSDESLRAMGLPRDIFCELAACDCVIGAVTEEASRQTGLPEGLRVVAGGEDTSSAGLAMGVTSECDVQLSMGTACTMYVPCSKPIVDARLLTFPHVLTGLTLIGGSMVSGGISIDWLLKLLQVSPVSAEAQVILLEDLAARAKAVPCGSDGIIFLPYLAGELQPINDGFARGVFFGLHLGTRREHLFRAVMEGTAYAIQHNLCVMREHGIRPERVIAVGAPAKNDMWCQIISDVVGLPLTAMEDRAGAALGDAILAAMGVGLVADPLTMQRAHAQPRAEFLPDSTAHERYRRIHTTYCELYPRLRDLFYASTYGDSLI